jgi:hypothetical protein
MFFGLGSYDAFIMTIISVLYSITYNLFIYTIGDITITTIAIAIAITAIITAIQCTIMVEEVISKKDATILNVKTRIIIN